MGKEGNVILEVKNLKKHFKVGGGATLKAVDDVSFFVREGETLGLVGESGLSLIHISEPTRPLNSSRMPSSA